ncbi:MAG: pyridoxal phosphate-dependent aminotransferase [Anaerolineales bacterium]
MKPSPPFASRLDNLKPEGAYAVMAEAQTLEADGRHIIHLEIGQPDTETFPHISQAGIDAIQAGYTRYNPPSGLTELRQVIADSAGKQRNLQINPNQVVVGPGAKPGLFFPTLALVEPGDEVIYPDPGFPTYQAMIEVAGGIPVPVPLLEGNNFSFNLEAFDNLVNDRTRLIILNSPSNPTGGVIPLVDLEHIARAAKDHSIWIISDEIYTRLDYEQKGVPSIAALPGMLDQTIIVDGFSKTYAMTGWRLGYSIMPEALAERIGLLLTHSIGCTATFTQIAGAHALSSSQELVSEMVADYKHRRDRLVSGLNAISGVTCQIPQGAIYAFPNVSAFDMPVRQLASRLLYEAGVAVLPGTDFGEYGEGYLRMCFATSREDIDTALERISGFLTAKI